MSLEPAWTATEPKRIPSIVFQKRVGGKKKQQFKYIHYTYLAHSRQYAVHTKPTQNSN